MTAHVQIKRVPNDGPFSEAIPERWAVIVDGVDLAPAMTPDGLQIGVEPDTGAMRVTLVLHAELDADLPDSVVDGLVSVPQYVAQPSDCAECRVRVAAARAIEARVDAPWPY